MEKERTSKYGFQRKPFCQSFFGKKAFLLGFCIFNENQYKLDFAFNESVVGKIF